MKFNSNIDRIRISVIPIRIPTVTYSALEILLFAFTLAVSVSQNFAGWEDNLPRLDSTIPIHTIGNVYDDLLVNLWFQPPATPKDTVLERVYEVHDQFVSEFVKPFENAQPNMSVILSEFHKVHKLDVLSLYFETINRSFESFRGYLAEKKGMTTLDDQMRNISTPIIYGKNSSFDIILRQIFTELVILKTYTKVLHSKDFDRTQSMCELQKSTQQLLYQIYKTVTLLELKGQIMMQFSFLYLQLHKVGDFEQSALQQRDLLGFRQGAERFLVKILMRESDNALMRCDPIEQKEGETYERITGLFQGFVKPKRYEWDCHRLCDYNHKLWHVTCEQSKHCFHLPECKGEISYCTTGQEDMYMCPADNPDPDRLHFKFLQFKNEKNHGYGNESCTGGSLFQCSNCYCICVGGAEADRFFSLQEVVSDHERNMVVTGVRFRKVNRILHLQIQQGILGPGGEISASSVTWKPLNGFKITDNNIALGSDYHTLTLEKQSIILNEVRGRRSDVVTGVRLVLKELRLSLEVQFTVFNVVSGLLGTPYENGWNTTPKGETTVKTYPGQGVPTEITGRTKINRGLNEVMTFQPTGRDVDTSSSTIPYIDIQEVVPNQPVALSGVGLYHRAVEGKIGFVAPFVTTYNAMAHVHVPEQ